MTEKRNRAQGSPGKPTPRQRAAKKRRESPPPLDEPGRAELDEPGRAEPDEQRPAASAGQPESILSGWEEESPLCRAQEIAYEAFDAQPPRQVTLARQALAICPDCADAYVLLAENAEDLDQTIQHYRQAVAAAKRALGSQRLRQCVGMFWGIIETRPYMRATLGLAECLWTAGQREESVDHLQQMLRLNPSDHQGARWVLANGLLELGRDDDLEHLLAEYVDDATATWAYAKALLAFRRHGDSKPSRTVLAEAARCNHQVPAYLTGKAPLPAEPPEFFGPGDEDEAVTYATESLPAWKATPGAISWLRKASGVGPGDPASR